MERYTESSHMEWHSLLLGEHGPVLDSHISRNSRSIDRKRWKNGRAHGQRERLGYFEDGGTRNYLCLTGRTSLLTGRWKGQATWVKQDKTSGQIELEKAGNLKSLKRLARDWDLGMKQVINVNSKPNSPYQAQLESAWFMTGL